MRCPNCGWPNKPNETSCVKCGSPLQDGQMGGTQPQSMQQGFPYRPQSGGSAEESLRKTVMESEAFSDSYDRPSPVQPQPMPQSPKKDSVCPKCGYPMRPDSNKCPNCNFIVGGQMEKTIYDEDGSVTQKKFQRHPTRQAGPAQPEPMEAEKTAEPVKPAQQQKATQHAQRFSGTVNPYLQGYEYIPTPTFSLKPMSREGELKVPPVQELEMEEETLVLNRSNTEPGNPTITSQEQALVSRTEDGRWFIENRSKQGTTFVQANKRTELHDGDVLLLGNRLFEFKVVE